MDDTDAQPRLFQCQRCGAPMQFVAEIPRVTEPGTVHLFRCMECEFTAFRDQA